MHTNILLTQITEILKNKVDQNLNTSLKDQELIHIINVVKKQDFSYLPRVLQFTRRISCWVACSPIMAEMFLHYLEHNEITQHFETQEFRLLDVFRLYFNDL